MMLPDSDPNCNTVSTLVFMDLEATGLPYLIGKSNVNITELSLVAIDRSDFESDSSLRVLNKLTICIRPRTTISPRVTTITGLSNDILEKQEKFDKAIPKQLEYFFRRLRRPLCLLAHCGNTFDFPLLQAELRRINCKLDGEILCADTLEAFRSIVSNTTVGVDPILNPNKEKQQNNEVASNMLEHTTKNERIAISEDETDKMENITENKSVSSQVIPFPDEFTTPASKNTENIAIKRTHKKFMSFWCPSKRQNQTTSTKSYPNQIKRQPFTDGASETSRTNTAHSKPTEFSLERLYYHYFGERPPTSHYAEADSIALSKVCQKISGDFLKWIDAHSTSFNETPAMW